MQKHLPTPDLIVVLEGGIEIIKQSMPFVKQMSVFAVASCNSTEGFIYLFPKSYHTAD